MNYIFGYYTLNLQQYILHRIQHTFKIYKTHRLQHHRTYSKYNITKIIRKNSIYLNLDLYFYGNIICMSINSIIFQKDILLFQLFLLYLSYYFHNEYHNLNSIWKDYSFYEYLKKKHQIHHTKNYYNYSLLDPTFDIIFNTYQ